MIGCPQEPLIWTLLAQRCWPRTPRSYIATGNRAILRRKLRAGPVEGESSSLSMSNNFRSYFKTLNLRNASWLLQIPNHTLSDARGTENRVKPARIRNHASRVLDHKSTKFLIVLRLRMLNFIPNLYSATQITVQCDHNVGSQRHCVSKCIAARAFRHETQQRRKHTTTRYGHHQK